MNGEQIRGIEAGEREVQLATMLKLARALGVHSLDEIIGPLPLEQTALL